MGFPKTVFHGLSVVFAAALLAGCGLPAVAPSQTPEPATATAAPPSQTPLPPTPTATPSGPREVFHLIRSVTVTPDEHFKYGEFGYIHYVPATNRLVVMMNVFLDQPMSIPSMNEKCESKAVGYKEYTLDLEPTGKYGFISCNIGDATSQILGNDIYLASMSTAPANPDGTHDWVGFRLEKFDAVTWERTATVNIPIHEPDEAGDGPTISFINGQAVVSGQLYPNGVADGPLGRGSHHHFFTTDLEPLGKKILGPTEYPAHCPEMSMLQLPGGDIFMFASSHYNGDLIMIQFDKEWNVKQSRKLRDNGFFPTGSTADGRLFYIAYMDTSIWGEGNRVYSNAYVAAFDPDWNLVQDLPLTDFTYTPGDVYTVGAATWVQLVGNRLYVTYQVITMDMNARNPDNQAHVNVYELTS